MTWWRADEGKTVKVRVSFTDDADNDEGPLTSAAYPATGTVASADGNHAATGAPAITGTAWAGQVLTADLSAIADEDGATRAANGEAGYAYSYQWIRVQGSSETDIAGATSKTYTLTADEVGRKVKVSVSFTDDADNAEGPLTSGRLPGRGDRCGGGRQPSGHGPSDRVRYGVRAYETARAHGE